MSNTLNQLMLQKHLEKTHKKAKTSHLFLSYGGGSPKGWCVNLKKRFAFNVLYFKFFLEGPFA